MAVLSWLFVLYQSPFPFIITVCHLYFLGLISRRFSIHSLVQYFEPLTTLPTSPGDFSALRTYILPRWQICFITLRITHFIPDVEWCLMSMHHILFSSISQKICWLHFSNTKTVFREDYWQILGITALIYCVKYYLQVTCYKLLYLLLCVKAVLVKSVLNQMCLKLNELGIRMPLSLLYLWNNIVIFKLDTITSSIYLKDCRMKCGDARHYHDLFNSS